MIVIELSEDEASVLADALDDGAAALIGQVGARSQAGDELLAATYLERASILRQTCEKLRGGVRVELTITAAEIGLRVDELRTLANKDPEMAALGSQMLRELTLGTSLMGSRTML